MGIISIAIFLRERAWYILGFERRPAWPNIVNKGNIGIDIWE